MMFPSTKNISFFKFSALLFKPGTYVVRQKLKEKVNDEKLLFPEFLNQKKHELFHLYKPGLCCLCNPQEDTRYSGKGLFPAQWKILFTEKGRKCKSPRKNCCCVFSAKPGIQEDDLDMSLAVCLLINLFPLSYQEKRDIEELRNQRNYLSHALNAEIGDIDYVKRLEKVLASSNTIADPLELHIKDKVCQDIREIMNNELNHSVCYPRIIELCWEDHMKNIKLEMFERVMEKVLQKFEEFKKTETAKNQEKISKDQNKDDDTRAEKLRKKLREIKFKSVHGFPRVRLPKRSNSSQTLPPIWKKGTHQRVSLRENRDSIKILKPDEKDFLLNILQLCKTESHHKIKEELEDLPKNFLQTKDDKGYCAIHYVAERSDKDVKKIISILINHGAYISDQTSKGMTVLHIACKNGNDPLIEYCLRKERDLLNKEDDNGWNAAMFAVFYGHMSSLQCLKKFEDLNIQSDKTNVSILHLACLGGKMNIFKNILENHLDIRLGADQDGRTSLHYVARGGNCEILDILLKEVWAVDKLKTDSEKMNPLEIACLYGHEEICRKLISVYPQMLHKRKKDGYHAIQYAVMGGKVEVMRLLMEFLDKLVVEHIEFELERNEYDQKNDILQLACVYQNNKMWKYIANEFPALLSKRDWEGWHMPHVAARCGNCEVLKIILEPEEELEVDQLKWNLKDNLGRTVLHIASLYGHFNVCKYLVDKFPQIIMERDIDECLACSLAANGGNFKVFCLLHDKSSKLNIINEIDKTHMSEAASLSKNPQMVNYIKENYPALQLVEVVEDTAIVDEHTV